MLRVKVTVDELSNRNADIDGQMIAPGQTRTFEVDGDLVIGEADAVDPAATASGGGPQYLTPVEDHGNPNGIVSAEIAPKLPKASGELEDVEEGGRLVQRQRAPYGEGEQGGGTDSKDGKTPGPKPAPAPTAGGTGPAHAAATGDVDAKGKPTGKLPGQVDDKKK